MTYNLTALYGTGPVGYVHALNTNTGFVFLYVLYAVIFLVVYAVASTRQLQNKDTLLVSSFFTFLLSSLVSFAMTQQGVTGSELAPYTGSTLVLFSITILVFLYHVLSDASQ